MALTKGLKQTNLKNFFYCFFLAMGQLAFGYPASVISVTLGQPAFLAYMGLVDSTGRTSSSLLNTIGATNGVFQAGASVNVILTAIVLDRFGRRASVYYNSFWGLLGGALVAGSPNISTFLGGRFFCGMSSFGFLVLTPVYTTELSPPKYRGFFVGLNGVFIGLGYAIAAWMGVAFHYAEDPITQWRGPLGLYLIFPILMIIIALLSPESPRWLLMQGKEEKAREVTMRIHCVGGSDEFAKAEFDEMCRQTEIDRTLDTSWWSMFTKPSYRKRLAITCFYCFLGQSCAILVINNYGPTFYSALGYDTTSQLFFQAGWVTVAPPFCLLGGILMDYTGRRFIMLFGIGGCCFWLIVEAAVVANFTGHPQRKSLGQMGVAALYLFNACYNVGVDVGGNVYYAEVFPNHIRSKGVAITNLVLALADLVYLQVTPYAFANIGWKFFLVFIIISGLGFFVLLFVLPETKGLPLEEVANVFGDDPNTIAVLMAGNADAAREMSDVEGADHTFKHNPEHREQLVN